MNRDIALKLDTLLSSACGSLDMIAHAMKNNLSQEQYKKYIYHIGNAMAELSEISNSLYTIFPDIIPDELKSGH